MTDATRRAVRRRIVALVAVPVLGLLAIVAGVVALEAVAPQADVSDRTVPGVPPVAIEEERSCRRPDVDEVGEEIRAAFPPGGRITSSQVLRCPAAFDGLEVTFVGEVVGELLPRSGGVWAQVNDDAYALEVGPIVGHRERSGYNSGLAVWLPDGTHEHITGVGRPQVRGDVLLVEGRLLRADPADGGGLTIRATASETLATTVATPEPFHATQAVVAALVAAIALGAIVWSRLVARR